MDNICLFEQSVKLKVIVHEEDGDYDKTFTSVLFEAVYPFWATVATWSYV